MQHVGLGQGLTKERATNLGRVTTVNPSATDVVAPAAGMVAQCQVRT